MSKEYTLITDWKFEYNLSPTCTYEKLPSTKAIEFTTEKNAKGSWVTGFAVSVDNRNKVEAFALSKIKARNVAIIISLKVGNPVREHHVGTRYKLQGQEPERWVVESSLTVRYNIFEKRSGHNPRQDWLLIGHE